MFDEKQWAILQKLLKRLNVSQVCREYGLNVNYVLQYTRGRHKRNKRMDMKILAMLIDLQEDNKKMVEELSIKATSSVDKSSFTFLEELYGKR
jgi:N-glycosylase/DNA lyase